MLHCLDHLYADIGFPFGLRFFFDIAFLLLTNLARDDYCIGCVGGLSLAELNRFWNPTTALLIIITIFMFQLQHSASSLSSSCPSSSSSSSSSSRSCFHHFCHHQFPSSFLSATSSTSKNWHCLWLAAIPKNHVRPLPHFDFTWGLLPYPSPASFRASPLASNETNAISKGYASMIQQDLLTPLTPCPEPQQCGFRHHRYRSGPPLLLTPLHWIFGTLLIEILFRRSLR